MASAEEKKFKKLVRNKTLKAFSWFFFLVFLMFVFWQWLINQPQENGAFRPLRKGFQVNEKIFSTLFNHKNLAKTFDKSVAVKKVRVNGDLGMKSDIDTNEWKLLIVKNNSDTLRLTMDEIKKLPKTEVIFDFKCIEGWSQITWWGGVKFSDFAKHYRLCSKSGNAPDVKNNSDLYKYAGLVTPDGEYYVGIDMASMLHPQTILCYEMNGEPLPAIQGAPLRLIIPVKYGIKHIKRIGIIFFSDSPPPDYWAEQGYDYYSGL